MKNAATSRPEAHGDERAGAPGAAHPLETLARRWHTTDPSRLVGRGHPVGDFLEAHQWTVLEEKPGFLRVSCHLPEQVRNPRGDLFGGFTPTYADLIAVFTGRAGHRQELPRTWLNTASLTMDYFRRITGGFLVESEILHRTGRTLHVQMRFRDAEGRLLALSRATLVESDRGEDVS